MSFVKPMLASPFNEELLKVGEWSVEEKFDGVRLIIEVASDFDLFGNQRVQCWSRYGKDREVPSTIRDLLAKLPHGVYDGELYAPGKRSYGTAAHANAGELVLALFDVVHLLGHGICHIQYWGRRAYLERIFENLWGELGEKSPLQLANSVRVESLEHVRQFSKFVWSRDGEGLILKRRDSLYQPGKRPTSWMKVKQLRSTVCTVVGYKPGKMGPHSILLLRDDDGHDVAVKWKSLAALDLIEVDPDSFLGRRLRIEYQERTPDGSYRHPRWDRWEDE